MQVWRMEMAVVVIPRYAVTPLNVALIRQVHAIVAIHQLNSINSFTDHQTCSTILTTMLTINNTIFDRHQPV